MDTTMHRPADPEDLGVDLARVRAYFASGPVRVPAPDVLLHPGPQAREQLWPLVARRNLKRLLTAFAAARAVDPAVVAEHRAIVAMLMALTDEQLDHLFTEPEVTSWLAGLDDPTQWDGRTYLDGLTPVLLAAAARAGLALEPLSVATDDQVVTFRGLGVDLAVTGGAVQAWTGDGMLYVSDGHSLTELAADGRRWSADGARQLPRTYADVVVNGLPEAWLRNSFPDVHNVSRDSAFADDIAHRVTRGLGAVEQAWPQMAAEIRSLLRWVVPMADGDSFFVPAFRGLVALPDTRDIALAFNVVHELSHNIMSCVYDLVDIVGNPDDRVRSPFSREVEPLSSVIHSCWAFSHELRAVRALAAADLLDPDVDWDRLQLKIRVFYDRALPVVREHALLSTYGSTLLDEVETIVYPS